MQREGHSQDRVEEHIEGLMGTIPPQLGLLTSLEQEINVERTAGDATGRPLLCELRDRKGASPSCPCLPSTQATLLVRDDSLSPNCEQSLSVYAKLFIAAPVVCVCIRALGAITRLTSVSHDAVARHVVAVM